MLGVVDGYAVEQLGREYREERLVIFIVVFVSVMLTVAEEVSLIGGARLFARRRIIVRSGFVEQRSRF